MAERRPFLLFCYRGLARALGPVFHLIFHLRCRAGKEIPARKSERFGRSMLPRPSGALVWIHAASVGETVSILPLAGALATQGYRILLTTVTVTAAEIALQRLPDGSVHQYSPFDAPGPVGRFLDHWRPDMAMVVESEIWPCVFDELRVRKTPFVLLNGRLSEKSQGHWARLPGTSRYIFGCLDAVLAQSPQDAARFRQLGCRSVEAPGNLKFDAPEPATDKQELDRLRQQIRGRPVWLAALVHSLEDEIALDAFEALRARVPDLLLVLVPRHPARADDIRALVAARNLSLVSRSTAGAVEAETQVFLGDTLGEMGLFYKLAPVSFLGGSFNEAGGHNPLEAALAGSALVTGPNVANASDVYRDFWNSGAALRVSSPDDLATCVLELLQSPDRVRDQVAKARKLVEDGRGALDKTLEALRPMLANVHREPGVSVQLGEVGHGKSS